MGLRPVVNAFALEIGTYLSPTNIKGEGYRGEDTEIFF